MRHPHRLSALVGVVAVMGTALAGPADARVVERGTIDESFTFEEPDYCGLAVTGEVSVTGTYSWKSHGSAGLEYYAEHILIGVTVVSDATGDFITVHERTMYKDLHLTDLGGGILDVVWFGTGNNTVYDSSGKAIARNPGQVRLHTVIDLHDPADDEDDEVLSEEVILGSTGRSDDFCAAVVPALS